MTTCNCGERASLTGFDDVRFGILMTDQASGELADWIMDPVTTEKHVPMSNITVVQHMGMRLAKVTWSLYFPCVHQYNGLLAKIATYGTLIVPVGVQSLVGTQRTWLDRAYEQLTSTRIATIANTKHAIDGSVEAQVTFARAVDPVTRKAVMP